MRKLFVLGLVVIMLATFSFGTEFDFGGQFRTRTTNYKDVGENFQEETLDNISWIDTRMRLSTTATMSDNLKAVLGFEIGDFKWGEGWHNADEVNVETKHAYLEFKPDFMETLKFTAGLQYYADQFGSSIFDEDAAGLTVEPMMDNMNIKAGMFVFNDDDVNSDNSHTFGVLDVSKSMDSLNLKGSFYYDDVRDEYASTYFGAGADYTMDAMGLGGHFIYMNRSFDAENTDSVSGYFAYGYGEYNMNDLNLKLNFGYSPASEDTAFYGIAPYAWLFGLEYAHDGTVTDHTDLMAQLGSGYGQYGGQMVLAANLSYKFLYANFGMINATNENLDNNSLGNEIDVGINYELTDGLTFDVVYAMFMPGDFDGFAENTENAYEFSTKLQYNF